jgi:hypothetical protein
VSEGAYDVDKESMVESKAHKRVLISGGIASLTLGIMLSQPDWQPLVVERDPMPRTEACMMDFFGTGLDLSLTAD